MKFTLNLVARICVSFLLATLALGAQAQSWPSKPLQIVSPYSPGGTNDLLSRLFAQHLSARLGQPVMVENRAGANGIIGADAVAKAPADGYTMLMGNSATHGINPNLYEKLPYDAERDFVPVTLLASVPLLLIAHPSVPASSVKELVTLMKAQPGKFSFASPGNGSSPHLAGELFKMSAGVEMVHIPYKGDGPAVADVLAGHVPIMFANMPSALPYVKSGNLKGLAMTGARRSIGAPEIPTVAEAGVPSVEISAWYGIMVPAKTAPEIIARLNAELEQIARTPEVAARIRALGAEPTSEGPEKFGNFVRSEMSKFAKVIKATGLKPQ